MTHIAYLLLGSNLGNRKQVLEDAVSHIKKKLGGIIAYSSIYETGAWGIKDQPAFLNQVVKINTTLKPHKLLTSINAIEKILGRIRHKKWDERIIDIDILYYDNLIINTKNLTIPHLEIANRRFTLVPLVELAANFKHPILSKTQTELLARCKDELEVEVY